jgi:2',3'-cyclic-nucleotide 2'-phosphodiesterase (5'-nucleotidase family)
MVAPLNAIKTSVACLGNHELDFGVEQFQSLAADCTFPWLCANVLDPAHGPDVPLGRCQRSIMLHSTDGIRIGVIGLVERDWLDTINALPPNLVFLDVAETARRFAEQLRGEGAEMVVCVTHQREPNDVQLANDLPPGTVDIILGGHDHFYGHAVVNGTHILRSGTDFKQLSYLECRRRRGPPQPPQGTKPRTENPASEWDFTITRRDILSSIPEDAAALSRISAVTASLRSTLDKPLAHTAVPLDARFSTVRTRESNMGNFIADLMQHYYGADCAVLAAGTIRGDQIYPAGVLRARDLMSCFPFEDPCVVLAIRGKDLKAALENAVGQYPSQEGRFPQVAGIRLVFDARLPPGRRITAMHVAGEPLDEGREYTLATREYMARGKDGYTDLLPVSKGGRTRMVVGEESGGLLLSTLLRQYFSSLKAVGQWAVFDGDMGNFWGGVQERLHRAETVLEPVAAAAKDGSVAAQQGNGDREDRERMRFLMRKYTRRWARIVHLNLAAAAAAPEADREHHDLLHGRAGSGGGWRTDWTKSIAPRVEGRIVMIGG